MGDPDDDAFAPPRARCIEFNFPSDAGSDVFSVLKEFFNLRWNSCSGVSGNFSGDGDVIRSI